MAIIREEEKYFAIPKNLLKYIVSLLQRKWKLHPYAENNEINVILWELILFMIQI